MVFRVRVAADRDGRHTPAWVPSADAGYGPEMAAVARSAPGLSVTPRPAPPAPAQPAPPPGRYLDLPGRGRTFVREAGPRDAPAVILLHGLGATGGSNFLPVFVPLAEQLRVVAIDHRGHGRGLRSTARFRLEDCADDVAAVADALGIDRFVVAGYSMGGPIAQLTWHRHPGRVAGLVLCATSRNFRGRFRDELSFRSLGLIVTALRFLPRRVAEEVAEVVPDDLGEHQRRWLIGEIRRSDPRSVLEAAEALGRYSSHEWIDQIDVPVSVLVMTADGLVPTRRQVKLARAIPTAVMHVVDGDHLACMNAPDGFAAALVEACDLVVRRANRRLHALSTPA